MKKILIRTYKAYTIEALRLIEKNILSKAIKAGFKTHVKDAVNYYIVEVYAVSHNDLAANKEA